MMISTVKVGVGRKKIVLRFIMVFISRMQVSGVHGVIGFAMHCVGA